MWRTVQCTLWYTTCHVYSIEWSNWHMHLFEKSSITVSSCVYMQSVSSEIRMKVGVSVIVSHVLHWVKTDLEMTLDANRGLRAVQNWAYTLGFMRAQFHFKPNVAVLLHLTHINYFLRVGSLNSIMVIYWDIKQCWFLNWSGTLTTRIFLLILIAGPTHLLIDF